MKADLWRHFASEQSGALHELAADRVLEVLNLVAIAGPVQGMRVSQADERRRLAQPFGLLPDAGVMMPVGMARRAGHPLAARHRRIGGVRSEEGRGGKGWR